MAFVRAKRPRPDAPLVYQLVEATRVDGQPRQRVLAYLGSHSTCEAAMEALATEIDSLASWAGGHNRQAALMRRTAPPGLRPSFDEPASAWPPEMPWALRSYLRRYQVHRERAARQRAREARLLRRLRRIARVAHLVSRAPAEARLDAPKPPVRPPITNAGRDRVTAREFSAYTFPHAPWIRHPEEPLARRRARRR